MFVGSRQIVTSRSWFPLTISSFGAGNIDWSSVHPGDIPFSYTTLSTPPTIQGIATAGSMVKATLTNKICIARGKPNCTSTTSATTGADSRYTLSVSPALLLDNDYTLQLSVSDSGGNYNALPEVEVRE